ncbi:MAG TPA: hypothetical protein DCY36_03895 [Acidimicrobiaceae bacterium]|nr:hypothetical protein [Acidimicrobiaceae bacterium]HAY65151.1 hypothetical protein [Acidimicrobiaceae bacterium]
MESFWKRQIQLNKRLLVYGIALFVLLYLLAVYQGFDAIRSLPTENQTNTNFQGAHGQFSALKHLAVSAPQ